MHFTAVTFQVGHNNEEGNNYTIIPDTVMEGRDKDTNDDSV
jgi:hypothetical protein